MCKRCGKEKAYISLCRECYDYLKTFKTDPRFHSHIINETIKDPAMAEIAYYWMGREDASLTSYKEALDRWAKLM